VHKFEGFATAAMCVLMNALVVLVALEPLSSSSGASVQVAQSTAAAGTARL
jgi:hypothetical protein